MPKKKSRLKSFLLASIKLSAKLTFKLIKFSLHLFFMLLPTIVLIALIQSGRIEIPGPVFVPKIAKKDQVHEIIPNTKWNHIRPCGEFFDEDREYKKALQCVNEKVWKDSPLSEDREELNIPRCFIISTSSPDVFGGNGGEFNFVPIMSIFGPAAVVGVYEPETNSVFVVENVDAPDVYRHELQHYFLHKHNPETGGGGHHQEIWKQCEPPYYTVSKRSKIVGSLVTDDDRIVIIGNERIR